MPVKVNDKTLTEEEIGAEEARICDQLSTHLPPEKIAEMRDMIKKQAVNSLVNRTLLLKAAEEEQIKVSEEEIDKAVETLKSQFESPEAYSLELARVGITQKDLRKEMETSLRIESLLNKHVGPIEEPTEAEARAFYDENIEKFRQSELVRASHILIKTEQNESQPERAAKRLEAAKILGEIQSGADFSAMASRHSACPSKQRGGDVGFFPRGRMVKPFEEAAFSLKTGEISGIVESPFGYHIIKVTERHPEQTASFESAKEGIREFLRERKRGQAVKVYTDKLRTDAVVEFTE
jgi:peptidyl-prolyl cis-trans isomerase C